MQAFALMREELAHQRLVKAELLKALELMLHEDGPISGDGWDNPWVEVARAAINRAKGITEEDESERSRRG
jgi:hypothetical protein